MFYKTLSFQARNMCRYMQLYIAACFTFGRSIDFERMYAFLSYLSYKTC